MTPKEHARRMNALGRRVRKLTDAERVELKALIATAPERGLTVPFILRPEERFLYSLIDNPTR